MTLTVLASAFAVRSARSETLSVFARQEAGKYHAHTLGRRRG